MKGWPNRAMAWAGVTVLACLLAFLAIVVLARTRRMEADASAIQSDCVPGLVQANLIRSTFSEEFAHALQMVDATTPEEREQLWAKVQELDQAAKRAVEDYRHTIHVAPMEDNALLNRVLAARADYLQRRESVLSLLPLRRFGDARRQIAQELTPRFSALMRACDDLVEFKRSSGDGFATAIAGNAAAVRVTNLWVISLVALVVGLLGFSLGGYFRAEREAREAQEKLALAFRVNPHSMAISRRRDGRIIAANDAFRRHYGLTKETLTSYTTVEVGVWRNAAERDEVLRNFESGDHAPHIKKGAFPDGSERTLLVSVEPLVLNSEPCLLTVGQDISERVRAEAALARSAAELQTIFENTAVGIALVNDQGYPVRTNPTLERFLGYSPVELRGMKFAQFTHPDDVGHDVRMFEKLIRGDVHSYNIEKRYIRKDGGVVWADLTTSSVRDDSGKLLFVVGMALDITERKQAALALHESEVARQQLQQKLIVAGKLDALGQLAGGVAHDFNNMVAAMTLHLDVMKKESTLSAGLQESIDELRKTARRAASLTRQLLLFSRREPAQRQVVDLDVVIGNLLKMLERLVGSHFTLAHVHDGAPQWVYADPGMLEQVVMNLVVNARDAMPRGGRIELKTDTCEIDAPAARLYRDGRPGRFVRLVVTDPGCGMNASILQRIFEPFFTTKAAGKGTGLGLSTVFGIVQQHSGWIDVASVEAQGTTVTVGLPAHAGPLGLNRAEAPAEPDAHGSETVLLVEDDDQLRVITARILRTAGYQVIEAANGIAAKNLLEQSNDTIDLLLSDVVMPGGIMGDELVRIACKNGRPKFILMSSFSADVDLSAVESAGGVYLSKPFNTDRLLRVVRALLDRAPGASVRRAT